MFIQDRSVELEHTLNYYGYIMQKELCKCNVLFFFFLITDFIALIAVNNLLDIQLFYLVSLVVNH